MDVKSNAEWEQGMTYVVVGRHINGIMLNDYEYLLDDEKFMRKFYTEKEAKNFLRSKGVTYEEIYYMSFFYWMKCPFCGAEIVEKIYNAKENQSGKTLECRRCKHEININTIKTEE